MNNEIARIQAALESGAYVKTALAKAAGVHPNTLAKATAADWSPTVRTVRKLCAALDRLAA